FAPDMPDSELDGNQMRQAVINICKNSIEAMPSGGRLSVSTRLTPQDIEVDISDTGTGLQREMLDKARQPFFTTKTYGVGLGLNIAEQIVRAHKGKMDISSGLDAGVRVNITLPRSA
ncbi:MAG: ATP-binding protein, partial [Deltaproteobacteria bacterium]|nr:ATP-binding protein [Deltaproteobacteria bacterium]